MEDSLHQSFHCRVVSVTQEKYKYFSLLFLLLVVSYTALNLKCIKLYPVTIDLKIKKESSVNVTKNIKLVK